MMMMMMMIDLVHAMRDMGHVGQACEMTCISQHFLFVCYSHRCDKAGWMCGCTRTVCPCHVHVGQICPSSLRTYFPHRILVGNCSQLDLNRINWI